MTTTNEKEQAGQRMREAYDKAQSLVKQAKEEILSVAWKAAPPGKKTERVGFMDDNIRYYLIRHFNPQSYPWVPDLPESMLFCIQNEAERSKPGARILRNEIKAILDKHAGTAPGP